MKSINITSFRKNIFTIMEQTVEYKEPVRISTKDGNVVVLSESDYLGMMETLYLTTNPEQREKLLEGKHTLINECVPEDEVNW